MNKSIKILLKWIVAPLLASWLFYSLYQQVKGQPDIDASIALIKTMPFGPLAWKFWMVIAFVFVVINLIVDISYAYLDPRVRLN